MTKIKAQVLREFGDQGADTLERYFAQVEYTAYWCIRMLLKTEHIVAVIPEGVEDIVVIRVDSHELHQVKTRDESQGPWTTAEVLPILCKQYYHCTAFAAPCQFHFVSDQMADAKTPHARADSLGALWRLRRLLELKADGQTLKPSEDDELVDLERKLLPKICEFLHQKHGYTIDLPAARILLHNTKIETNHPVLRNPNNLVELDAAFADLLPGHPPCTQVQLRDIYDRLLLLIIRKILIGTSLETRRIEQRDVLTCRTPAAALGSEYPDLNTVPGETVLDKKAHLGGFDATELPRFHRQKKLAEWSLRRLESIGLDQELERFTTALLDLQGVCRHRICRELGVQQNPGPHILAMVHPLLGELTTRHLPHATDLDEQFCLGVLWRETDLCSAWWHRLKDGN